jgi:hypothetical protein
MDKKIEPIVELFRGVAKEVDIKLLVMTATLKKENESLKAKNVKLKAALDLAMYYVEGDATHEGLKLKIDEMLNE